MSIKQLTHRLYLDELYKNMEYLYINKGLKEQDWQNFKEFASWVVSMEAQLKANGTKKE